MEGSTLISLDVQGLEQWRESASSLLLPMAVAVDDPAAFRATIDTITAGGVRAYRISATTHESALSERLHLDGNDPFFAVVHQVDGESSLTQFGKTATLRCGDFAVYDTTSPYSRRFAGTTLVLLVPQQLVHLPPHAFSEISALRIAGDSGAGAIASSLLSGMAANLDALAGSAGRIIMQSTVDVVSACVSEALGVNAPSRLHVHLETLMEVREYIMANLGDHRLNPQTIAEAHFISVRTLHALFKEQGTTVASWVRERRLEMARRDLVDEHNTDAVRSIGQRWGFVDATHFSNAFKLAFGASPREFRKAALLDAQRRSSD